MPTRKTQPIASTVQAQLIVNAPPPVTVSAPDTAALVKTYTEEILPLAKYTIATQEQFVAANLDWTKARNFSASIDALFDQPCKLANQAHKALTSLREGLKAPADAIASHVGGEILRYRQEQERIRQEQERQLAAEQERLRREEEARLKAIAEANHQRILAERQKELDELPPWEREDAEVSIPEPVAPVIYMAPPTPIRIASSVPVVAGGPTMTNKPWSARLVSLKELVQAAAKDDSLLEFLEFNQSAANRKARELQADLGRVVPGLEGFQEQTLKRA